MRVLLVLALAACPGASSGPTPGGDVPDASGEDRPDAGASAATWRQQVLYLAIPDRFRNGDPTNDNATNCHDPAGPRRFHGGDLAGLRGNLGYLAELGATALWITPPNKQSGPSGTACGFHGYWIDYADPADDALQPELGGPAELEGLSDDLHARGMRLVLDMVVNHAGRSARIPQQHPDWFHAPQACGSLGPAQVYCPLSGLPDFAQEKPEVAAYLSDLEARAVTRYRLDGIRMDTAKHVPASYFQRSFFPAVRAARDLFVIAEIFDQGSTAQFPAYLDAGFDSAFHYPLYAALTDAIGRGGSTDRIAQAIEEANRRLGRERALDLVLFVDNHDVPRFANVPGSGVPEDEIRRRFLLALALVFTLPGIPQLYYGDELGMYGGEDPDNRRDLPAWAGDPAERMRPHRGEALGGVYSRVQRLARLRTTVPALADGEYRELWRQNGAGHANVLAFARGRGGGVRIVIANNADARTTLQIPVPADVPTGTRLVDELGDGAPGSLVVTGGRLSIDLPAKSAAIYGVAP